jgi:hypothetical protein
MIRLQTFIAKSGEELTGTPSQIEWAQQIRRRVNAEFDRVALALEQAVGKQSNQDRLDTDGIISILQKKRAEVMAENQAGYFMRHWQELGDQMRQMIDRDPAYQVIKAARQARSLSSRGDQQISERSGIE